MLKLAPLVNEMIGRRAVLTFLDPQGHTASFKAVLSKNTRVGELPYRITWFDEKMKPLAHQPISFRDFDYILKHSRIPDSIMTTTNYYGGFDLGSKVTIKLLEEAMDAVPVNYTQPPAIIQKAEERFDPKDVVIATLIGEAGGEKNSLKGMTAVMNVIVNRTKGDKNKFIKASLAPSQFSLWNGIPRNIESIKTEVNRLKKHSKWNEAKKIVDLAESGKLKDITNGANHYYNPKKVNPKWAKKMKLTANIGNHRFLKA